LETIDPEIVLFIETSKYQMTTKSVWQF